MLQPDMALMSSIREVTIPAFGTGTARCGPPTISTSAPPATPGGPTRHGRPWRRSSKMERSEALSRLASARSGHLATTRPEGTPHLVVVTFALVEEVVVTAIDHKPKTTQNLQRLRNIEANPAVSFLADGYDDDWVSLWWVRVDGAASILLDGELRDRGITALATKYPQYHETPPAGPVITVSSQTVTGWAMTP